MYKKGKCGILVSLIEGSRNLVIGNSFDDLEKEKGRKKEEEERKEDGDVSTDVSIPTTTVFAETFRPTVVFKKQ